MITDLFFFSTNNHKQTYQGAGIGRVGRVLIQKAREAEVGNFAHQVAVNEDVACCQVAVDVVHVGEVLHSGRDASQHADELRHREPTVVQLEREPQRHVMSLQ